MSSFCILFEEDDIDGKYVFMCAPQQSDQNSEIWLQDRVSINQTNTPYLTIFSVGEREYSMKEFERERM